ncbi:MAG TPA: CDP-alcohol phosphatidyltransferase family protein, partial [Candidatus Poseidoniales archaeon]
MALEGQRTLWEKFSKPLIKKMDNVDPVVLTWLTLPTGLTAAYLLWKADASATGGLMLLGASILMLVSMTLDGLDGTLARAKNATSRWGDFLDHTLDRVLDVTWIVAIGYNATWFTVDDINAPELAWAAAMAMIFGSHMGTQA